MTGWVNRFANAGDTAMEVAGNTALRVRYEFQTLLTKWLRELFAGVVSSELGEYFLVLP